MFNVAGDGVLALTEVAGLLGKPYAPILPPWGTGLAAAALRRVGVRIPPEALAQLRFGRGVDNRRFKASGFRYQHTTREAVLKLGEHLRLHPVVRGAREPYRYEREVEEFLRWSPHVRNAREKTPRWRARERRRARPRWPRPSAAPRRLSGRPSGRWSWRRGQRKRRSGPRPPRRSARPPTAAAEPATGSPVEHYDDLGAEEIIAPARLARASRPPDAARLRAPERQPRAGALGDRLR